MTFYMFWYKNNFLDINAKDWLENHSLVRNDNNKENIHQCG